MGDKAAARRRAAAHGVPVVPGYDGDAQDDATLAREAARIGYPLLVKPSAGGGGKGMRVVRGARRTWRRRWRRAPRGASVVRRRSAHPRALPRAGRATSRCRSCSTRTAAGVHLGERDCSAQRRNQKIVEEAPAPSVTPELRAAHGRGGAGGGARGRLCERRHGRDAADRCGRLLLPRDEHPPPGRAPGHRGGHGPRPRRGPAADRGRGVARGAGPVGRRRASAGTRSRRASTPRIRSAGSCRRPGGWRASLAGRRPGRHRRARGRRGRATDTTRCWPSSSPTARPARRVERLRACARTRPSSSASAPTCASCAGCSTSRSCATARCGPIRSPALDAARLARRPRTGIGEPPPRCSRRCRR